MAFLAVALGIVMMMMQVLATEDVSHVCISNEVPVFNQIVFEDQGNCFDVYSEGLNFSEVMPQCPGSESDDLALGLSRAKSWDSAVALLRKATTKSDKRSDETTVACRSLGDDVRYDATIYTSPYCPHLSGNTCILFHGIDLAEVAYQTTFCGNGSPVSDLNSPCAIAVRHQICGMFAFESQEHMNAHHISSETYNPINVQLWRYCQVGCEAVLKDLNCAKPSTSTCATWAQNSDVGTTNTNSCPNGKCVNLIDRAALTREDSEDESNGVGLCMEACTTAEDCRGGAPGAEWQCDDVSIIGFKTADSLSKMEQAILWYLSLASIVVLLTCCIFTYGVYTKKLSFGRNRRTQHYSQVAYDDADVSLLDEDGTPNTEHGAGPSDPTEVHSHSDHQEEETEPSEPDTDLPTEPSLD